MDKAPVDIWTIPLLQPSPEHLSGDEVARANRFRFEEDRIRWVRARSALRLILSGYAGDDPSRLCFTSGTHGKPALLPVAHVQFNLSHAGDWALVAVTHGVPVGVDIERIRANVEMASLLTRLGEGNLPETTQELYQVWTRREARSKAVGGALFDRPPENAHAVRLNAPDGYAASVALIGCEPDVRYCGDGNR